MQVQRTAKGHSEVRARDRHLSLRERGALFLVDVPKPLEELAAALGPRGLSVVQALLASGHLELLRPEPATGSVPPATAGQPTAAAAPQPQPRKSLAEARLFLFDCCDRAFARRAPADADHFRQALRQAREVEAMLDIADDLFARIAAQVGDDRADRLRGQFTDMLPGDLRRPVPTSPAPLA